MGWLLSIPSTKFLTIEPSKREIVMATTIQTSLKIAPGKLFTEGRWRDAADGRSKMTINLATEEPITEKLFESLRSHQRTTHFHLPSSISAVTSTGQPYIALIPLIPLVVSIWLLSLAVVYLK